MAFNHLITFEGEPSSFCLCRFSCHSTFACRFISSRSPLSPWGTYVFTGGQGPTRSWIVLLRWLPARDHVTMLLAKEKRKSRDANHRPHPRSKIDALDRSATVGRLNSEVFNIIVLFVLYSSINFICKKWKKCKKKWIWIIWIIVVVAFVGRINDFLFALCNIFLD